MKKYFVCRACYMPESPCCPTCDFEMNLPFSNPLPAREVMCVALSSTGTVEAGHG